MANAIKYSTGSETLALKKGNFYIGTGDVGKGPTSTTGYYNGITPPSGGYTVYLNKASGGPSIYTPANDAELISLTNQIAGTSYTTVNECLVYYASQSDKVVLNRDYGGIVTDGLILNVDAGFTPSYPRSGTTWYDLSLSGNNGTLINGPTFSGDSIIFDGVDDYVFRNTYVNAGSNFSVFAWVKPGNINIRDGIVGNSYPYSGREGFFLSTGTNYAGTTNTFFLSIGSDVAYRVAANNSITLNIWNYIGGTVVNGGQDIKLYVNGIETSYFGGVLSSGTITYNTNQLYIGGRHSNNLETFTGNIATTQIYNRVLSAQEIQQNFNAQKARFGL